MIGSQLVEYTWSFNPITFEKSEISMIRSRNRTEWSATQGVIWRVI